MDRFSFIVGIFLSVQGAAVPAATLHRGAAAEPNSLDPQVASGNSAAILYDLNIGLTSFDNQGRVIPGAASSWDISSDGLTYTFHLRPDLKWSDGSPMTAHDFVYSARRLLDPATGARFGPFLFAVKNARAVLRGQLQPESLGVEAPDASTVVYHLQGPAAYFLQNLGVFGTAPVPERLIEKEGRRWARPGQLLSSGAYRLVEWVPQSHITLEKNPYFFAAETVRIDRVRYYPTANLETALRRYRAGELDILLRFPLDKIRWLRDKLPGQMRVWPALGISYILLNNEVAPFDDARVRRALAISIDRESLIDRVVRFGYPVAYTLTPSSVSAYDEPVPAYANLPLADRLAEARRLLEAAGYGAGRPLAFKLQYQSREESRRIVVALASMWQALGVEVELLNTDFATLNKRVRTDAYQASRFSWFAPNDDPETFLGLLESSNPNNHSGYQNPQFDSLIRRANNTLDPDARLALMREAESLALNDHPVIPIYFHAYRYLVAPQVKGFTLNPRGINGTRYMWLER